MFCSVCTPLLLIPIGIKETAFVNTDIFRILQLSIFADKESENDKMMIEMNVLMYPHAEMQEVSNPPLKSILLSHSGQTPPPFFLPTQTIDNYLPVEQKYIII